MHLVDADGRPVLFLFPAVPHPLLVAPDVGAGIDDRRGGRRPLAEAGHRVGLLPLCAISPEHLELVQLTAANPLDEERPYPGIRNQLHSMLFGIPTVEVADAPNLACVRRPPREAGA